MLRSDPKVLLSIAGVWVVGLLIGLVLGAWLL